MNKLFFAFLIVGFLFAFYGNFFGIDFGDEGLAILGFTPGQQLGINFTHYQLLIQKLFPEGLDFIIARQLRTVLIIVSSVLLLLSVYYSRLRKNFLHFSLIVGATTLISLGTGVRVLSYNALNQFFITISAAALIQYIDAVEYQRKKTSFPALILMGISTGFTYLIRLPSFIPYVFILSLFIWMMTYKEKILLIKHSLVFFSALTLTVIYLDKTVVPFSKVVFDVLLFAQMSSLQPGGHGFKLVTQFLLEFTQKLSILFFAAVAFYSLQRYFQNLRSKLLIYLFRGIIFTVITLVIVAPPLSVSSLVVFFSFLLVITYYGTRKESFNILRDSKKLLLGSIFPIIAIASTLGSNDWIINLLLFYLSIWMVGNLIFISEKNTEIFKKISYILVVVAILKVLFTGFIDPHGQANLLADYKKFDTETRGTVFLDSDMYNYVMEIKDYLKDKNLYGKDIVAVSRLAGLVYLLDSNMPGSINFTDAYWQVYCESLKYYSPPKNPVVIFRGNIPSELVRCLAENGINIPRDYKLVKKVNKGFSIYNMPTYIYIKNN